MPLKEGLVFNVMACAYRHDVIDKYMSITGEAIDAVMRDTELKIGDLVNRMDEAQEQTVMKLDGLLARSGPLLKLAANDRVMAALSRILDFKTVRRTMVGVLRRVLVKAAVPAAAVDEVCEGV